MGTQIRIDVLRKVFALVWSVLGPVGVVTNPFVLTYNITHATHTVILLSVLTF